MPERKETTVTTAGVTNVPAPAMVRYLGTVHVIGNGSRFVLVQAPIAATVISLADGQNLVCRAAGNVTATLRVSAQRRPPFVVADVATGTPNLGDEVFIEPTGNHAVPAPVVTPPPAPEFRADPALPSAR